MIGLRLPKRGGLGGLLDRLLAPPQLLLGPREALVFLADPFLLVFDLDLPPFEAHDPDRPRLPLRGAFLFKRLTLLLEHRLLGFQSGLPGPKFFRALGLGLPETRGLAVQLLREVRQARVSRLDFGTPLRQLFVLDFQGLLAGRQVRKSTRVILRLSADGVFFVLHRLFPRLHFDFSCQEGLIFLSPRGVECLFVLRDPELSLSDFLGLCVQVIPPATQLLLIMGRPVLELPAIGIEGRPGLLEDDTVLIQCRLAVLEIARSSGQFLVCGLRPCGRLACFLFRFPDLGLAGLEFRLERGHAPLPRVQFLPLGCGGGLRRFSAGHALVDRSLEL